MSFFTEPVGYKKPILEHAGFAGWGRVLFHIDEAMSWETVRHLERMECSWC